MDRPLILLSNDDGHLAPGLHALRRALNPIAEVVVCAPEANQSASSHSLSLHHPLRLTNHGQGTWGLDGTPADCVYVALNSGERLLPRRPDIIVSGMNAGMNLGSDVFYSGTVAAAREGALRGIPALAVSAHAEADREAAAALGSIIARGLLASQGGPATQGGTPLLNLNIPRGETWTVQSTCLGIRRYVDEVVFRTDPRNNEYLWIGGANVRHDERPGSDTEAYDAGRASLTALSLDMWNSELQPLCDAVVARADELK